MNIFFTSRPSSLQIWIEFFTFHQLETIGKRQEQIHLNIQFNGDAKNNLFEWKIVEGWNVNENS